MLKLGFKSVPLLPETVSVLGKEFHIMETQCWISEEEFYKHTHRLIHVQRVCL